MRGAAGLLDLDHQPVVGRGIRRVLEFLGVAPELQVHQHEEIGDQDCGEQGAHDIFDRELDEGRAPRAHDGRHLARANEGLSEDFGSERIKDDQRHADGDDHEHHLLNCADPGDLLFGMQRPGEGARVDQIEEWRAEKREDTEDQQKVAGHLVHGREDHEEQENVERCRGHQEQTRQDRLRNQRLDAQAATQHAGNQRKHGRHQSHVDLDCADETEQVVHLGDRVRVPPRARQVDAPAERNEREQQWREEGHKPAAKQDGARAPVLIPGAGGEPCRERQHEERGKPQELGQNAGPGQSGHVRGERAQRCEERRDKRGDGNHQQNAAPPDQVAAGIGFVDTLGNQPRLFVRFDREGAQIPCEGALEVQAGSALLGRRIDRRWRVGGSRRRSRWSNHRSGRGNRHRRRRNFDGRGSHGSRCGLYDRYRRGGRGHRRRCGRRRHRNRAEGRQLVCVQADGRAIMPDAIARQNAAFADIGSELGQSVRAVLIRPASGHPPGGLGRGRQRKAASGAGDRGGILLGGGARTAGEARNLEHGHVVVSATITVTSRRQLPNFPQAFPVSGGPFRTTPRSDRPGE